MNNRSMNQTAIVVLNWNSFDDTINCIESLISQTTVPDIIVVDNNSSDNSKDMLQSYVSENDNSQVTLILNSVNSGYSGGINVGIRDALDKGYHYIGTLNPDAIADRHWTSELLQTLTSTKQPCGIATGLMAKSNHTSIDTTGEQYSIWGIPGPRFRDQPIDIAPNTEEYIFASTGGGFIARADMLREIGLFDEKFFMYFEDVDLCFRAQLAGYKVRYTPKAIAYHKVSASTNKVPGLAIYNTFKNLPILFIKNVPLGLMPTILPRFTLAYVLILGNAIVHGKGKYALSGCLKTFILIPHALRERKHIQSSRKVSNAYISSVILHDIPPEQTGLRKFRAFFTGKQ